VVVKEVILLPICVQGPDVDVPLYTIKTGLPGLVPLRLRQKFSWFGLEISGVINSSLFALNTAACDPVLGLFVLWVTEVYVQPAGVGAASKPSLIA